jgi:hypothetical protein
VRAEGNPIHVPEQMFDLSERLALELDGAQIFPPYVGADVT